MRRRVLSETRFRKPAGGWHRPDKDAAGIERCKEGIVLNAGKGPAALDGEGVHTRNGDRIELHFRALEPRSGSLSFGFAGGFEYLLVTLDFAKREVSLSSSDWTRPNPEMKSRLKLRGKGRHVLAIEKTEGSGGLIKQVDLRVFLDDKEVLTAPRRNALPEMGVLVKAKGTRVLVERFVQRGQPSGVPEYFRVGGWQVLNQSSTAKNLASLEKGIHQAAEAGVQLLVTPETSLTGLFPSHPVTRNANQVAAAERRLRRIIKRTKSAPHVVVGLPVWRAVPGHPRKKTRFNASRVYAPDGSTVCTGEKVHSCEDEFWHGRQYIEFDVEGVPVTMHICHDTRYPDLQTVPVMFGARLVVHPSNGGQARGSVAAFERAAKVARRITHAFHVHVNGGGGSFIIGPRKHDDLLARSTECYRDNPDFPSVGEPQECLIHARIRVHDAFGYWPERSFRASEETAKAFLGLYRSMGGKRER